MSRGGLAVLLGLALTFGAAQAQMYRWVDEQGRVRYSDRPPPPGAKKVEQKEFGSGGTSEPVDGPFELQRAMKNAPVMLYTSPTCKEACSQARSALNARGVPFREVQVWNEETNEELKRVTGGNEVPVLLVGRDMQKGYLQTAYDSMLDVAGYPKAGSLPPRRQAAPTAPEGYLAPSEREAKRTEALADPKPAAEEPRPTGPYAPRFGTK